MRLKETKKKRKTIMRNSGVAWRFFRKIVVVGVVLIGVGMIWRSISTSSATLESSDHGNRAEIPKKKGINLNNIRLDENYKLIASHFKGQEGDVELKSENTNILRPQESGRIIPPPFPVEQGPVLINTEDQIRDTINRDKIGPDLMTKIEELPAGCQRPVPFGQSYQADISTYDLPKITNYTLDKKGRYIIPVKQPSTAHRQGLETVQVVVVPFSHADPGYGRTIEEYYMSSTMRTLENMVDRLSKNRNMTFQWVETVFLERWWRDTSEMNKQKVRDLIARGQLEIVLGGWVMPDEASTHYASVVDQLIEGHQWLLEHLGVKVKDAWVNDPFGYSSTMPYLWKLSGIENMVFLRIHQAIKSTLMKKGSLEFNWKPYWSKGDKDSLLCSLMSYEGYWVGDVCGPTYDICSQFAFMHSHSVRVTDANLELQATKLYEQYRITADLYKYNTLYIGIGEDFSFTRQSDWDEVYQNFDKLMNYINNRQDWKMKIKFGTLADYFNSVRKQEKLKSTVDKKDSFPTLSGDFFPYSDKENAYWTGYFTTRPLNKRISREIEPVLRIADIYNVLAYSYQRFYGMHYTGYNDVTKSLRYARRELGMFLHHDGITGTSLPHVVADFEFRLKKAEEEANSAMKILLATVLSRGSNAGTDDIIEETQRIAVRTMSRSVVIDPSSNGVSVIAINPLERHRRQFVNVILSSKDVAITNYAGDRVALQLTEGFSDQTSKRYYAATFQTELPPFAMELFKISFEPPGKVNAIPTQLNHDSVIVLQNLHMKAEFDGKTGLLKRITDNEGRVTNVSIDFMVYRSSKGGAYLFGPDGPATSIVPSNVAVSVSRGHLTSSVIVTWRGVYHKVTMYNSSSVQGHGIFIRNEIDIAKMGLSNSDIVLRMRTCVKNGDNFFTDQNGFTLIGRQNNQKGLIQSNFYPITVMAVLEDSQKRMTLHSGQPLGVASLSEGQLEVMLDRTMLTDDGRGLGQGVSDRLNVDSEFIIQIEYKSSQFPLQEPRYAEPSVAATSMNEQLQKPILKYILRKSQSGLLAKVHPLKTAFPCDVSMVGLRNMVTDDLKYNGTSLVLHRKPMACGYQPFGVTCNVTSGVLSLESMFPKRRSMSIQETSLSHVHLKSKLSMQDDLRPAVNEIRAFKIDI